MRQTALDALYSNYLEGKSRTQQDEKIDAEIMKVQNVIAAGKFNEDSLLDLVCLVERIGFCAGVKAGMEIMGQIETEA